MKQKAREIQYTVRGIPREVDRALRKKAAKHKLSLNQIILDELTAATTGSRKRADFDDLVGKWTPDPGFDEIIASQRKIDPDKWQ
jgi:plasmid stability protein